MGNRTVDLAVQFIVRIQQVEGNTSHIGLPYIGMDRETVGIGNMDYQLSPVRLHHFLYRKLPEILWVIMNLLLPVHRQSLVKIAITI